MNPQSYQKTNYIWDIEVTDDKGEKRRMRNITDVPKWKTLPDIFTNIPLTVEITDTPPWYFNSWHTTEPKAQLALWCGQMRAFFAAQRETVQAQGGYGAPPHKHGRSKRVFVTKPFWVPVRQPHVILIKTILILGWIPGPLPRDDRIEFTFFTKTETCSIF